MSYLSLVPGHRGWYLLLRDSLVPPCGWENESPEGETRSLSPTVGFC